MPARKRPNEEYQPTLPEKVKRRRTAATGGRWGLRDIQKSGLLMGETIIVNQALLPAPVTDHETPNDDDMDIDPPSPPETTACQPSESRDLTVQGQGKTGCDGDGEKCTHRSVGPEAMIIIPARDYARLVACIPPDPQGYAPTTPAGPLTTQTSAADTYNGLDAESRLDRLEKRCISLGRRQEITEERVDKNEENLRSMLEEDKRRREANEAARQEEKEKEEQRRKRKEEEQQKRWEEQQQRWKEQQQRWEEEKRWRVEEDGRRKRKEEQQEERMERLLKGMTTLLCERKPGDLEPPAPPTEAEPGNVDRLLPPPATPQLGSKKPRTYGPDAGSKKHNTRSKGPAGVI